MFAGRQSVAAADHALALDGWVRPATQRCRPCTRLRRWAQRTRQVSQWNEFDRQRQSASAHGTGGAPNRHAVDGGVDMTASHVITTGLSAGVSPGKQESTGQHHNRSTCTGPPLDHVTARGPANFVAPTAHHFDVSLVALLDGFRVEAPAAARDGWRPIAEAKLRLTCPECGQRMVGRNGLRRIPHFAHFAGTSPCSWGKGETAEHLRLKWEVAEFIRSVVGWTADLEVRNEAGSWRADVLAIRSDGRRIAVEVQLAAQTIDETRERTERFAAELSR